MEAKDKEIPNINNQLQVTDSKIIWKKVSGHILFNT